MPRRNSTSTATCATGPMWQPGGEVAPHVWDRGASLCLACGIPIEVYCRADDERSLDNGTEPYFAMRGDEAWIERRDWTGPVYATPYEPLRWEMCEEHDDGPAYFREGEDCPQCGVMDRLCYACGEDHTRGEQGTCDAADDDAATLIPLLATMRPRVYTPVQTVLWSEDEITNGTQQFALAI